MDDIVIDSNQKMARLSPLAVETALQRLLKSSKSASLIGVGTLAVSALYVYMIMNGYLDWTGSLGMLGFIVGGGLILGRSFSRTRAARRMLKRLGDNVSFTLHDRVLTCEGEGGIETLTLMYREKLLIEAGGIPVARLR
jgi:hypothetical protein